MASLLLEKAGGMRIGKCRPDTVYLRQFPGKRRFERVSREDWEVPLPHKDIAGFGHILRLEADIRVLSPDGDLQIARKWPSRSYIRNMARIFRNLFGQNVQLVDAFGNNRTVPLNNAPGVSGAAFLSEILPFNFGTSANPEYSGGAMAVGNGVAAEVHTRNDLVNRVSPIISSRQNLRTSVLNTATTTLEITTGITNATAAGINVTEIGYYLYAMITGVGSSAIPFPTLLIYDGVASTPVAAGGVIAPRYTMDFPV
jgi:hypothetical protein